MAAAVAQFGTYSQITATTTILSKPGQLLGIFVASASATPTIQVLDGAGGATVVDTFTPVAATWYPMPIRTNAGLRVVISGTVDCTVVYNQDSSLSPL